MSEQLFFNMKMDTSTRKLLVKIARATDRSQSATVRELIRQKARELNLMPADRQAPPKAGGA